MKCKIWQTECEEKFEAFILNKYKAKYYHCNNCGFLFIDNSTWLKEAYLDPINEEDTGIISRNIRISKRLSVILFLLFNKKSNYLDFAGGYGLLVRIMRDIGFNFYWEDQYTENIFAKGFEWNSEIKIEAVTLFECFEHFLDPIEEIEKILKVSNNIIFSTELIPENTPNPDEWWYYGLSHGQHISFYSKKTLIYIAKKYNLKYYNIGNIHILSNLNKNKILLNLVKLDRFGINKLVTLFLKSKTFEDHLKISNKK
jgi:hypothetical protein